MLAMMPRLPDLALVACVSTPRRWAALVASGVALRVSWRAAGGVVQALFVGNVLPTTMVVATLYQEVPTRVCNA